MQILDISVPIRPGMITWPREPGVSIEPLRRIAEGANANVSLYSFGSHTGTHLDPPLHFIPDGEPVDRVSLDACYGPALVVAVTPAGAHITATDLEALGIPPGTERLLLKTPNERLWQESAFDSGFVGVDVGGARWLTARGLRLVGIDYLSIAPYGASRPTHLELLSHDCLILEGLNFAGVEPGEYILACFPLRVRDGDGSPVRAVLIRP